MSSLNFTVDSALLKELGERLVGKPHIALAELVKNSYDADATQVTVKFEPRRDSIVVKDDGNGMDLEQFTNYWMRIGSPHKQREAVSERFGRPLTGSKGVGRLAAQFLAGRLSMSTTPIKNVDGLVASVDWDKAVKAGDLTHATVDYNILNRIDRQNGTEIRLEGLRHGWEANDFRDLAKEIWWLQPPFRRPAAENGGQGFEIKFESPERDYSDTFDRQLRAILDIWQARLVGKNSNGKVNLSLEFAGEQPQTVTFDIPDCKLNAGDFEIRIYHLEKRQPHGIKVREARQYFKDYGGIHVYDAGFRLPYYGTAQSDWLRIEADHSHRLNASQLLPTNLQVDRGLNFLPTVERMFGVVNVNTSKERDLTIQITRDRLAQSRAYENLVFMLRWAIDFYAMEEARRAAKAKDLLSSVEPTSGKAEKLNAAIEAHRKDIPPKVYKALKKSVNEVIVAAEEQTEVSAVRIGLLGSLATAGISTLAYQHELQKQLTAIDGIIEDLGSLEIRDSDLRFKIQDLRSRLNGWVKRAKDTQALFSYLAEEENRSKRLRMSAFEVLDDVKTQTSTLARGIELELEDVDKKLLLPKGTFAEWTAIFQNVIINAFNAVLDASERRIRCSSRKAGKSREILIEDTGTGVNLKTANRLFEPFVRESKISKARQALGYGGTGLGLTIVKLVAGTLGCTVEFVRPSEGFSTAFRLHWKELE